MTTEDTKALGARKTS